MRRAPLLFGIAALLSFPVRSSAEVMEGDHLVMAGYGVPAGASHLGNRAFDYDNDGTVDAFRIGSDVGRGNSASLEYLYQATAAWGFGIGFDYLHLTGETTWRQPSGSLSSGSVYHFDGTASATATSIELIPMVRYTFQSYKQWNPYLLAGIGLNDFSLDLDSSYSYTPIAAPHNSGHITSGASSIGLTSTIGGGVQASILPRLLVGAEARWTICQIARSRFGQSSWNRFTTGFWVGTKWNSPL